MNILLIVDDFIPNSTKVAALMMHDLALEFIENGHTVTVLTPAIQSSPLNVIELNGIKILYFKNGKIKNTHKVKRAFNETLLSWNAWKNSKNYLKGVNFDSIIYYSPSIFWGILVKRLKKLWNCPAYLILRDIFPQWALDNELLSRYTPFYYYFKFFEWYSYKNANNIGVMSIENINYFKKSGYDVSKFEILHNWSRIKHNLPTENQIIEKYRDKLNLHDKIIMFYGGNIGHAQNMIYLINLAKKLILNPKVHFLFVGNGDEVNLLLNEKTIYNLTNITYLESVDQDTYFNILDEADIGLFSLHPKHKTHNFPGKLLGYMAHMKPILGCVNKGNDLMKVINDAHAGIVCESDDEDSLINNAIFLINSIEERILMGKNGKNLLISEFSSNSAYQKIISSLTNIK